MPAYWKGAYQNVSGGKHGTNISDAELRTNTPYVARGWDFATVWAFDSSKSPYPILKSFAPVPPASITLSPNDESIKVGESITITASGMIAGDSVSWEPVDSDVATVTFNGNLATVVGKKTGIVIISATTAKGAPIHCVTVNVEDILDPDALVVAIDVNGTCSLDGMTKERTQAKLKGYSWQSDDESVATVDQKGEVTGKKLGTAKITATNGDKIISAYVLVRDGRILDIERIYFEPDTIELPALSWYFPVPTIEPAGATNKSLIWTTDNEDVAMVNSKTGAVAVGNRGVAVIRAIDPDNDEIYGEFQITSIQPVTSVVIEPPEMNTITVDDTMLLGATVGPDNATDPTVTWKWEPADAAHISETGEFTALMDRSTVTVTASAGGVTSAPITIRITSNGAGLDKYTLASWSTNYFDVVNSTYYARQGELKNTSYITGIGLTDYDINGAIMRAKGWDNSTDDNPKAWQATIPAAGYSDFIVSFEQRAADNSPNEFILQYSTDGIEWIDVEAYKVRNWDEDPLIFKGFEMNVDIPAVSDNLYIRWKNASTKNLSGNNQMPGIMSFLKNVVVYGHQ